MSKHVAGLFVLATVLLVALAACSPGQAIPDEAAFNEILPECSNCGYVNLGLSGTLTVTDTSVAGGTSQQHLDGLNCNGSQIPVTGSIRLMMRSDHTVQGKPVTRPIRIVQLILDCN